MKPPILPPDPDPDGLYTIEYLPGGTYRLNVQWMPALISSNGMAVTVPPVPEKFIMMVGKITWIWGQYEEIQDELCRAFIRANKSSSVLPDNFKRRCTILSDEMRKNLLFSTNLVAHLDGTIARARRLHAIRNMLVHGHLGSKITARVLKNKQTFQVRLVSTTDIRGKISNRVFTLKQLKDSFDEISLILSRISHFIGSKKSYSNLRLHERFALLEFRDIC